MFARRTLKMPFGAGAQVYKKRRSHACDFAANLFDLAAANDVITIIQHKGLSA